MFSMLTEKQYKALSILRDHPKGIVVGYFAELYYTEPQHQYLVTYAIKKGKLCAGSLLGKLKKRGLVTDRFVDKMYWKFFLTREGRIAMFEYETKDFTSVDESWKLLAEGKDIFSAEKYYQRNGLPETGGWYLLPVPDFEKQATMDLRDRFFQVYKADVARGEIVPAWRK